jgi:hypothetical protein
LNGQQRFRGHLRCLTFRFRRNRNIDQQTRVRWLFLLAKASNGDRECEIVCGGSTRRVSLIHLDSYIRFRRRCAVVKWQRMLRLVRPELSSLRPISLNTLIELAAPLLVEGRVHREIPLHAFVLWYFLQRRHFRGITKTTPVLASSKHRATLRADCIHRCVLRCGRSHSGEEETRLGYHFYGDVKQKGIQRRAKKSA